TYFVGTPDWPALVWVHNAQRDYAAAVSAEKKKLLDAACSPDRNGLSVAGRSLQKHGAGARPGNRRFPAARGNPEQINAQAKKVVNDILSNPGTRRVERVRGRFGQTTEFIAPDGRGIVYDAGGRFLFFIE
ncbi:MAG TPA: hypothetical protein PKD86_15710, partial [Gemmatales bacterium]|nr:hypothetical protein [Gemmatales bacterium]